MRKLFPIIFFCALLCSSLVSAALPDFVMDRNITFTNVSEGVKNASYVCFKDGSCMSVAPDAGNASFNQSLTDGLYLTKGDQRYNDSTALAQVNTSSNILFHAYASGINKTTELFTYFSSLFLGISDQRYNETSRITDLNTSLTLNDSQQAALISALQSNQTLLVTNATDQLTLINALRNNQTLLFTNASDQLAFINALLGNQSLLFTNDSQQAVLIGTLGSSLSSLSSNAAGWTNTSSHVYLSNNATNVSIGSRTTLFVDTANRIVSVSNGNITVGNGSTSNPYLKFIKGNGFPGGVQFILEDGTTIRGYVYMDAEEDLRLKADDIYFEPTGKTIFTTDTYINRSAPTRFDMYGGDSNFRMQIDNNSYLMTIDMFPIGNNATSIRYWRNVNTTGAAYIDLLKADGTANSAIRLRSNGNSWLDGGNVGIGTQNPTVSLHVNSSSNSEALRISGPGAGELTDLYVRNDGAFVINNINGSDTTGLIQVQPEDNNYGFVITESDGTGTAVYGNMYVVDAADDYMSFQVREVQSGTAPLIITNANFVGINKIPTAPLDVNGTASVSGNISTAGTVRFTGFGEGISQLESTGTLYLKAGWDNGGNEDIIMLANTVARMIIKNDGRVGIGIGTSTPSQVLHVNGSANVTNEIYIGNAVVCRSDGTNCPASGSESDPVWNGNASRVTNLEAANVTLNASLTTLIGRVNSMNITCTGGNSTHFNVTNGTGCVMVAQNPGGGSGSADINGSDAWLNTLNVTTLNANSFSEETNYSLVLTGEGLTYSDTDSLSTEIFPGSVSAGVAGTLHGGVLDIEELILAEAGVVTMHDLAIEPLSGGGGIFRIKDDFGVDIMNISGYTGGLYINGYANITGQVYSNGVTVCQSDGTNCPSGSGGFIGDQGVNRTSNVTYNSVNISSPGDPILLLNGSGYCWRIKMESTQLKIVDCDGSVIGTFNKDSDSATFTNLVGTSSYAGAVAITGTSASGQTANILEIKNSSGSVLLRVDAIGALNASKGIRTNITGCDSVDTLPDGTFVCGTDAGAGSGDGTGGWTNTSTVTSATVNVSISPGNQYQINGEGIVTRTSTNAIILGNVSGDARGTNAIDVQQRTQTTEVCSGTSSVCFGYRNTNSGTSGVAIGLRNTVTNTSFAFGQLATSSGFGSYAFGSGVSATNESSYVLGRDISNNLADTIMIGLNQSGKLTISENGYVGINDETPSYTLEVNGTLAADGYPVLPRWTNKTTALTAVTGTTLANISGLEWTALANTNYSVDCTLWYDSNLTTNGISFAFEDWGGAVSTVRYGPSTFSISATTVNSGTVSGMGTKITSTGVTAANTVYLAKLYATIINGATKVVITPQMSAEVASGKSQVNIMSTCEVKEI